MQRKLDNQAAEFRKYQNERESHLRNFTYLFQISVIVFVVNVFRYPLPTIVGCHIYDIKMDSY